ncbi:response regulator transcription factor, partial [Deinococcus pimensis]|uniref:response regulator transcription factor n=1 Tax=Deinococcus pimensis TaxID=309888 RepID=UPI000A048E3F
MTPPVVVVVEDEPAVREAVAFHLAGAGLRVRAAPDARAGWDALPGADAVVLDWTLPDLPGVDWLRRLREDERYAHLPVLMLTARASEVDRVEGLNSGSDDYLTKPFSAAELVARVHALLRRAARRPRALRVGRLRVDVDAGGAEVEGRPLDLTRREFELLAFLAGNAGRVYSRRELLDRVWGEDFTGGERTVDQHVAQLRAHLALGAGEPGEVETVYGRGYRMRPAPE